MSNSFKTTAVVVCILTAATVTAAFAQQKKAPVDEQPKIVEFYREQIKKQPKKIVLYVDLVELYIKNKDFDNIAVWLGKALTISWKQQIVPPTSNNKTRQLTSKIRNSKKFYGYNPDEHEKLQQCMARARLKAARLVPNSPQGMGILIQEHQKNGQYKQAQDLLENGLLTIRNRTWFLFPYGYKNHKTSLETFQKQLKKVPNDFVTLYRSAAIYLYMAETKKAIASYEKLLPLAQNKQVKVMVQKKLGNLYQRNHDYEKTLEIFKAALEGTTDPSSKAFQAFQLGVLLQEKLSNIDEALKYYKLSVTHQPNIEKACRWRIEIAKVYIDRKQNDAALKHLNEVLKLSKNDNTKLRARRFIESLKKE